MVAIRWNIKGQGRCGAVFFVHYLKTQRFSSDKTCREIKEEHASVLPVRTLFMRKEETPPAIRALTTV